MDTRAGAYRSVAAPAERLISELPAASEHAANDGCGSTARDAGTCTAGQLLVLSVWLFLQRSKSALKMESINQADEDE